MRGTGTTTQQLQGAPKGALFIWNNNFSVHYAKGLCERLGRTDIEVVGSRALSDWQRFMGKYYPAIIVDHALDGRSEDYEGFAMLMKYCLAKPVPGMIDIAERISREVAKDGR
jgi:hypothetical protein